MRPVCATFFLFLFAGFFSDKFRKGYKGLRGELGSGLAFFFWRFFREFFVCVGAGYHVMVLLW